MSHCPLIAVVNAMLSGYEVLPRYGIAVQFAFVIVAGIDAISKLGYKH